MSLPSVLAFKKLKKTSPPPAASFTNVFTQFFVGIQGRRQQFLGPYNRRKLALTYKSEILDLGSQKNLAQHGECPIFSVKNHSTLIYSMNKLLLEANCSHSLLQQGGVIQHFFQFLKTYTFLLIRYIFRSSIPKKSAILTSRPRVAHAAKFLF